MLAKSLGDISLQRCEFVIELITKRKSNPRDWVSGAARWWCFCYSLCKEGTQMDEKKLFCNRKIFPKKDPQSWTQLTPFSCFRSFWPNSGCSNCAVVSMSVQPADLCDVDELREGSSVSQRPHIKNKDKNQSSPGCFLLFDCLSPFSCPGSCTKRTLFFLFAPSGTPQYR